jgi:hypothetical protein
MAALYTGVRALPPPSSPPPALPYCTISKQSTKHQVSMLVKGVICCMEEAACHADAQLPVYRAAVALGASHVIQHDGNGPPRALWMLLRTWFPLSSRILPLGSRTAEPWLRLTAYPPPTARDAQSACLRHSTDGRPLRMLYTS